MPAGRRLCLQTISWTAPGSTRPQAPAWGEEVTLRYITSYIKPQMEPDAVQLEYIAVAFLHGRAAILRKVVLNAGID